MRELHLFAGIGGGILAGEMLGHRPVCAVEIDPFCRAVLKKHWPELPVHDDVRTFPAEDWRDRVDIVAGGFPCQDISSAGKGAGITGARSGLWFQMLRVVCDVRPRFVFVENSPLLRTRGLDAILAGLAQLGFDAAWETLSAADVGANHLRKRMWILAAHPDRQRLEEQALHDLRQDRPRAADSVGDGSMAVASSEGLQIGQRPAGERSHAAAGGSGWWHAEPNVGRVVDGVPSRVDRLRALGNAQVPLQAATAFQRLMAALTS